MIIHQHADCGKATAMAIQWDSCSAFRVQRSAFPSSLQNRIEETTNNEHSLSRFIGRTGNQEPGTGNQEQGTANC